MMQQGGLFRGYLHPSARVSKAGPHWERGPFGMGAGDLEEDGRDFEWESLSICVLGLGLGQVSYLLARLCRGTALIPATCVSLHLTLVRISATLETCHQSLSHLPQHPLPSTPIQ